MKKYALCIGNNDYHILGKLNYAVNDAKAVAKKLSILGFDVDTAFDLKRDELNSKIVSILDALSESDIILLYYAGHGFQVNNQNILVPVDFNDKEDPRTAHHRGFPINELMELLDDRTSKTKIIIIDACREMLGSRGAGNNFSSMIAPQGSIIAFSTSPGQTAKEENGHGIYTRFLLDHMDDSRINIETMFKRVRMDLAEETCGKQISWEHTSLIGEFQLNPNTIYDGINYSIEALADGHYVFDRDSQLAEIVDGLKILDWNIQRASIKRIKDVDFNNARADDVFVLGRNIYQAACGCCYDCQRFIDSFANYSFIPIEAKTHILNGMAYEIYYNSEGRLRRVLKWEYADSVIGLLETESYHGSLEFISTHLVNEDRRIFYIPGQSDKIRVKVITRQTEKGMAVDDIVFKGASIYFDRYSDRKPIVNEICEEKSKELFEAELRKKMAVMKGYLKVQYDGTSVNQDSTLLVPFNDYNLYPMEDE